MCVTLFTLMFTPVSAEDGIHGFANNISATQNIPNPVVTVGDAVNISIVFRTPNEALTGAFTINATPAGWGLSPVWITSDPGGYDDDPSLGTYWINRSGARAKSGTWSQATVSLAWTAVSRTDTLYQLNYFVTVPSGTPAGNYTIMAFAKSSPPAGGTQVAVVPGTTTVTVITGPLPIVSFTKNATDIRTGDAVGFRDTSTGLPAVNMWNWSFGDGTWFNTTTSGLKDPSHVYGAKGLYNVSLTASNANGPNTTALQSIGVYNQPFANFTAAPNPVGINANVQFTDSSTGDVTTWAWTFGDGATSAAQNPTHAYATAGNKTVTLTVGNPAETSAVTTKYVEVVAPPVSSFTANATIGRSPLAVLFTDTSSNTPTAWKWYVNDTLVGTTPNLEWTFTTGAYNVKLNASNLAGGTNSSATLIRVFTQPVAAFTAAPNPVSVNTQVQFTDTSTGSITTWAWTFGDGETSTAQNPTHTYTTAGNKTVNLTVGNPFEQSEVTTNYVEVVPPIDIRMSSNYTAGTIAPRAIQFNDTSGSPMHAWNWSFGDGSYSDLQNPAYTFPKNGTYLVTFKANDTFNITGTTTATLTFGLAPVPAFTTNVTLAYVNDPVLFTDQSKNMVNFRVAPNWSWCFGDGSLKEYGPGPKTHTYTTAGTYTVNLTVFNEVGGPLSTTKQITVDVKKVVPIVIPNVNTSGGNVTINMDNWTGGNFSYTPTDLTLYNLTDLYKVVFTGVVSNVSGNITVNATTNVALFTNAENATMPGGNVITTLVANMGSYNGTGMIDLVFGGSDPTLNATYQGNLGTSTLNDVFVVLNITTVGTPTVTSSIINISVPYSWYQAYPATAAANDNKFTQIIAIHNGVPQLLVTTYGGDYWLNGVHYAFYTAPGPGFSTFGIIGASGPASPPGPSPGPSGGGGGGGSGTYTGKVVTYGVPAKPGLTQPAVTKITTIPSTGVAESGPIVADLVGMEGVSAAWSVDITKLSGTPASISTSIIQQPSAAVQNSFRTALQATKLDVAQIAYVMQVTKNNISSTGPATITMSVPQNWINNYGGIDAIRIVRNGDDGSTEVLTTKFANYDLNTGYLNFKALSPNGLSTFGIVAVKTYVPSVTTPAVTPVVTATSTVVATPVQPTPGALPTTTIIGAIIVVIVIIGIGIYFYTRKHD